MQFPGVRRDPLHLPVDNPYGQVERDGAGRFEPERCKTRNAVERLFQRDRAFGKSGSPADRSSPVRHQGAAYGGPVRTMFPGR